MGRSCSQNGRILTGKRLLGRSRRRWEENMKTDLKDIQRRGGVNGEPL